MIKAKPFCISKMNVWRAYERVKANHGSAGIDRQSIEEFEVKLKDNLYKIWNRMSSGTYFPPPVKAVEIPKKDGGTRKLGIPTVSDRIAQMVVKLELEPLLEPVYHKDSYGYRPNKSAHQAVETAKRRCWKKAWVIDLDIKGFFDNIDHELLMKAVKHHTEIRWVILYIERWLRTEIAEVDGTLTKRQKGTPQGGVISPLLANLFLHYAFDVWINRTSPEVEFERYADDIIIHCKSEEEAHNVLESVKSRMKDCRLELHPDKTKIVFCRNLRRCKCENYENRFDFLGFTFRQRTCLTKDGKCFDGFLPGISNKAMKKIKEEIKKWKVIKASHLSLEKLSEMYNPVIRGWVNYYAKFYPGAMQKIHRHWDKTLTRWAQKKYKRFKRRYGMARSWVLSVEKKEQRLFATWVLFERVE